MQIYGCAVPNIRYVNYFLFALEKASFSESEIYKKSHKITQLRLCGINKSKYLIDIQCFNKTRITQKLHLYFSMVLN